MNNVKKLSGFSGSAHRPALLSKGFSLLEVLITMVIMAFGLLGLTTFQAKSHVAQVESYQRAQAVILVEDMANRLSANRANAPDYITGTTDTLGTGDDQPADCSGEAMGSARDMCEWSSSLKGTAETQSGTTAGAMIGAQGCIERLQVSNPTPAVCTPSIYRVTVVWQGLVETVEPAEACGDGDYGNDALRRAVTTRVILGLPACV